MCYVVCMIFWKYCLPQCHPRIHSWKLMQLPLFCSASVTAVFELGDGTLKRFTRIVQGSSSEHRINGEVSNFNFFYLLQRWYPFHHSWSGMNKMKSLYDVSCYSIVYFCNSVVEACFITGALVICGEAWKILTPLIKLNNLVSLTLVFLLLPVLSPFSSLPVWEIHFDIIAPCPHWSSKWLQCKMFLQQNLGLPLIQCWVHHTSLT